MASDTFSKLGRCRPPEIVSTGTNKSNTDKFGLLVDGDHVGHSHCKAIMEFLHLYGSIPIRRIYLNESRINLWGKVLTEHQITPVTVPRMIGGNKDRIDLMIAMDAMEMALQRNRFGVSAIAIASNDIDFGIVLDRVHQHSLSTYAVVLDRGQVLRMHEVLGDLADHVLFYKDPNRQQRVSEGRVHTAIRMDVNRLNSEIELAENNVDIIPLDKFQLEKSMSVLYEFVYDKDREPLSPAIVKFAHVNRLGKFAVWPQAVAIREAYNLISSPITKAWQKYPGGIVFVERWKRPSHAIRKSLGGTVNNTTIRICGGGPFLARIGPNFFEDILTSLGYVKNSNLLDAVEHFFMLSQKVLIERGVVVDDMLDQKMQNLHQTLSAHDQVQFWKVPHTDQAVR